MSPSSRRRAVVTAVGANERFTFEYEFGDSWEHEHLSQWVGRPVDPAEFDLALVNAYLQMVR